MIGILDDVFGVGVKEQMETYVSTLVVDEFTIANSQ